METSHVTRVYENFLCSILDRRHSSDYKKRFHMPDAAGDGREDSGRGCCFEGSLRAKARDRSRLEPGLGLSESR